MHRGGRLPISCPSCSSGLRVKQLACPDCGTTVHGGFLLPALARLGSEDQAFALAFVLGSGSLKEMAKLYGVSYPTVRNRLDDLIARLKEIAGAQEKQAADNVAADGAGGAAHAAGNDE